MIYFKKSKSGVWNVPAEISGQIAGEEITATK